MVNRDAEAWRSGARACCFGDWFHDPEPGTPALRWAKPPRRG